MSVIDGMSKSQIAAAVCANKLNAAQMATALKAAGATEAVILEKLSLFGFSKEASVAAVVTDTFTKEQAEAAVASLSFATAEGTTTAATVGFSTALKGLGAVIKANPILAALSAAAVLIPLIVKAVDAFTISAEEAREAADELHTAFEETTRELESLNSELETSKDRLAELLRLSEAGTITIVEQEELDNLREEIALLEQRERFLKAQKEQAAKEANDALETAFDKQSFTSDLYTYAGEGLRQEIEELNKTRKSWTEEDKARYDEIAKRLSNLGEAAYRGGFDTISGMHTGQSMEYVDYLKLLIDRYNELNSIDLSEKTQADIYEMDALKTRLEQLGASLSEDIQQYEGDGAFKNLLQEYLDSIDAAINKSEVFEREIEKLPEKCAKSLSELGSNGMLNSDMVDALAEDFPELDAAMKTAGLTVEQVAAHFNALSVAQKDSAESSGEYKAQLVSLSDVISGMKSSYDVLKSAQDDMASGAGLSDDTIEKLAKENENYLDYLYEENGAIKLNTEAWKANADAMMHRETAEIQKEIDSINAKNDALRDELKLLEDQRILGDPNGEYAKRIAEIVKEINKNSAAIEENQDLLRLYTAIYQQVSGDGNDAFSSLTDALTSITGQYDLLNKAQDEFVKSGALSAATLSSIVAKFPEMQKSVDLYIAGLKSEKELLADLSAAYGVDLKNYQNTVLKKMENSTEFYNSLADNQKKLIDELGEAYGVDLKNFQTIESKKLEFQSQIIKNLASNYSKYAKASLEGLKAQQDAMLIHGGYDSRELKALSDAINAIDNYNYAISHITTGAGLVSSWSPDKFSSSGSSSSSSTSKEVEEYVAAIDDYREALEQLERVQEKREGLEYDLSNAGSLEEEIELQNKLLDIYQQEQDAIRNLNKLRGQTISEGVDKLRKMGFEVDYDQEDNQFFVKNLEHLNELTAKSKGSYETVQEATDALRKDTEDLIGTLEDLNGQNQDGSKSWKDIANDIKEANIAIYESRVKASENEIALNENWLDNAIASNDTDGIEKYTANIIEQYRKMQEIVHAEADYYRSQGYADTSDEVSKLSDLWWDYEKNIKDVTISAYEAVRHVTENQLGLTETHLEQAMDRGDLDSVSKYTDDVVAMYRRMQENVHQQAEYYRSKGLAETSDEIRQLSSMWWDYERNIADAKAKAHDAIIGDIDNKLKLTENWMNKAVESKNLSDVKRRADEIVALNKAKQEELHEQAKYYRSQGDKDSSDRVSDLSDQWYDCADAIKEAKQAVIDFLADIVTSASEAIDEIQDVYSTLKDAADEFAASGFISVDAYQEIIDLGPQYMQYLEDENGLLVINEDHLNKVIAAKTEQLALDNAMTYVERLKLALQEDSIEDLNELLFATTQATSSTWGLVYANLALLDLDGDQYQAALHNINAIRALADAAIAGIGKESGSMLDSLNDMKDGLDDILKYVMDMLKQRINDQIDALEDMKDAYSDIIDMKKKSLDASKNEADYEKKRAAKLKEIAKLQARIDILALDSSREAQAERAKLLEEMAELQEDLSEDQADKALEATKDSLDDMKDAYQKEKDAEITILRDKISSYQKLYDMA